MHTHDAHHMLRRGCGVCYRASYDNRNPPPFRPSTHAPYIHPTRSYTCCIYTRIFVYIYAIVQCGEPMCFNKSLMAYSADTLHDARPKSVILAFPISHSSCWVAGGANFPRSRAVVFSPWYKQNTLTTRARQHIFKTTHTHQRYSTYEVSIITA